MIARRLPAAASSFALLVLAACGSHRAPGPEERALGGGVVARVGDVAISGDIVARVASARGLSPREARAVVIDDAVAAEAARARHLDASPQVRWTITTVLARRAAERFREDARAEGPPSDAELAELTAARWREVDLPEQIRVVHAVILRPDPPTQDALDHAREVAAAMQRELAKVSSWEDFGRVARAFPHAGLKQRVEPLPAFVEDGRTSEEGSNMQMDAKFASAAFALKQPGETSGVVETIFGWHVIRLIERLPPNRLSVEERRAKLDGVCLDQRAARTRDAVLSARRARTPVSISDAAEQLMAEAMSGKLHD